jgi:tRNA(fMet)-specific endonuclease VapC
MITYLLDTNIVVDFFAGDLHLQSRMASDPDTRLCVPVLGELLAGAFRSARATAVIARIESLISGSDVLPCSRETARRYAVVRNDLRAKGNPIPENDVWIAAIALEHGLTLVTRDKHFGRVNRLSVERW